MEINGYFFRNRLKKTRRRFALSAGEQALYTELTDICNEEGWRTSFQVSNGELITALNCSENTLGQWRQSLINAGLIIYCSGKSKRAFSTYTMVVETTSKTATKTGVNTGTDIGGNPDTNPSDYNKLNKTKLNETFSKSHSGDGAPAKKKKALPYWKSFVGKYHDWYESHVGEKYSYMEKDFAHLKKLYQFLQKRAETKKLEFTEEYVLAAFEFFLKKAWDKDNWLRQNFSIPNILSQFNQIANGNGKKNEPAAKSGSVVANAAPEDFGRL